MNPFVILDGIELIFIIVSVFSLIRDKHWITLICGLFILSLEAIDILVSFVVGEGPFLNILTWVLWFFLVLDTARKIRNKRIEEVEDKKFFDFE
jgi:hypothetical protein